MIIFPTGWYGFVRKNYFTWVKTTEILKESTQYLQSMKGGILGKSMMELRQILLIQASVRQRESFFPITCYIGNLVVIGKSKIRNSNFPLNVLKVSKVHRCKDQESIQSSTTPDPGYQWESDKLTEDTTNESQEVSPFPAGDHEAHINRRAQNIANTRQNKNIKDPQKKYRLGTVSKIFYWRA